MVAFHVPPQQAHNIKMTSYQRRCDVITSHRRWYDVILTLCAYWVTEVPLRFVSVSAFLSALNFRLHLSSALFYFTNHRLARNLYVKLKDWMSNSVDPDETAHCCLQKPIIIVCDSERVKRRKNIYEIYGDIWLYFFLQVAYIIIITQQTHDVYTTSSQRRCNVMTLHRRWDDVV